MIDGLISGKVYGRPEQRTGRSGKPFTVAKVRAAAGDGDAVFVNVVAFDERTQAALLALGDGDAVALAGTLTPKAWTDRGGVARPSLDMVAAQVLTAYHVRRKREAVAAGEQRQQPDRHGNHLPASPPTQDGGDGWPAGDEPWA